MKTTWAPPTTTTRGGVRARTASSRQVYSRHLAVPRPSCGWGWGSATTRAVCKNRRVVLAYSLSLRRHYRHHLIAIRLALSSDCELPHRGMLQLFSWRRGRCFLLAVSLSERCWGFTVDRISPTGLAHANGSMAPSLPPVVWGSTSLRIGRVFRCNVTEHIEVLNVFSPLEMDVLMGRRFSNATEVNIICL